MIKHFFSLKFLPVFGVSLIISAGCNNANKVVPAESVKVADSTKNTVETKSAAVATESGGMLNSLWTEDSLFRKLTKKKVIFCFKFLDNDNILLDGWYLRKGRRSGVEDSFNLAPDISLKTGVFTGITYDKDTYFGNIVLSKDDVKRIIFVLDSLKYTKVIFYPKITDKHIGFDVYVSDNQFEKDFTAILAVKPTGIVANPSPPKEY